MRRGFEGLFTLAQEALRQDPISGHLFVFSSRKRNRLKILFWDGTGVWVCAKRLARGRITWPAGANEEVDLPRLHAPRLSPERAVNLQASSRRCAA